MHNTRVEVLYIQVLTLRRPTPLPPHLTPPLNTLSSTPTPMHFANLGVYLGRDDTGEAGGGRQTGDDAGYGGGWADDGRAQNFEHGFFDQQLESLMEVLKMKRIWGLNVGENFGVSIPAVRPLPLLLPTHVTSHPRSTLCPVRRCLRFPHLSPSPHMLKRTWRTAVEFRTSQLSGGEMAMNGLIRSLQRAIETTVWSRFQQKETAVDGALTTGCAPQWRAFSDRLHETAVSHMYASEHHFRCVSFCSPRCMMAAPQGDSQHAQTSRWVHW